MRLSDISTVTVGQIMTRVSTRGVESKNGKEVRVLVPGAISGGAIVAESIGTANLLKEVDDEKITHRGDVVIKLSTPYDAAYIDEKNVGLVIPSFCAAIRLNEDTEYTAEFVNALLNSSYIRDVLTSKVMGSTRPMIRVSDIRDIELPNIGKEKIKLIGDAFTLSIKKKAIMQELIMGEERIMNDIILKYMTEER